MAFAYSTIQLWIKLSSTFVDCSDWLLNIGDVDTIFNNYDMTLRLVETTAQLSSTILTDKSIDDAILIGKDIQIKFDSKIVFVGYITKSLTNIKDFVTELDIASSLKKLETRMVKDTYYSGINASLFSSHPVGERFIATTTIDYYDYVTYLGWEDYTKYRDEGLLGDHNPPLFTNDPLTLIKPKELARYLIQLLTGYACVITDDNPTFPMELGEYDSGLCYDWMWNFNQDYCSANQDDKDQATIPTWWEFLDVFFRESYNLVWNSELSRFELRQIKWRDYEDYREYPLPEPTTTYNKEEEVMNMRRNMKSSYSFCQWFKAYINDYTRVINPSTDAYFEVPKKLSDYAFRERNGMIDDATGGDVDYGESNNYIIYQLYNSFSFPFPDAGLYRFRKSYNNIKVLTNPIYDVSDWDGAAFRNLLQNKFVNKDGLYFSELELFEEVV